MTTAPRVQMRAIHKVYGDGTLALRGVDFRLEPGEIVALLGENGAGKTTLMKILSGLLRPTRGEMLVDDRSVQFRNPSDALRLGIGMVHQSFTHVPPFTALQNIMLGQEGAAPFAALQEDMARARVTELVAETGLSIPLDIPVESLPIGVQQRVEILKTLYRGTTVLILDEPTSALTLTEVHDLFQFLGRLTASGKSVVFISHKLKEVQEISDRVMVLRGGLVTGEVPTAQATPERLAELMVGHKIVPRVSRSTRSAGVPVLAARDLQVATDQGALVVKSLSFEVRAGEIVGIAGVEGNGQSELIQALTGLRSIKGGEIVLNGARLMRLDPLDLYHRGMGHIPEDKARFGLALNFDLAENTILSRQRESAFAGWMGRLNWSKILAYAQQLVERFKVVAPGLRTPVRSLSGGNQQRLVVGRELSKQPVLIVAVHPTRGLDISSTVYIRELLVQMRDEGKGVLLVSADLDEILELSDRIAVMYEGTFLGTGNADEFTREEIGMMMGGMGRRGGTDDKTVGRAPATD
jgi:simple sugar transport system ATP-binding protein